jgi:hypothetical protein
MGLSTGQRHRANGHRGPHRRSTGTIRPSGATQQRIGRGHGRPPNRTSAGSLGRLRRIGYSCSDSGTSRGVLTRACTRVRFIESARVQLVVTAATGAVQLVTTTIDEGRSAQVSHRQILEVLADALALDPADRRTVLAAVVGNADQSFNLGWGSFTVRHAHPPSPRSCALRSGTRHRPAPTRRPLPDRSRRSRPQRGTVATCVRHRRSRQFVLASARRAATSSTCGRKAPTLT